MIFDMERASIFKVMMVTGIAVSLQGCVAVAFPIAAGGVMARSAVQGSSGAGSSDAGDGDASDGDGDNAAAPAAEIAEAASTLPQGETAQPATGTVVVGSDLASEGTQPSVEESDEQDTSFAGAFEIVNASTSTQTLAAQMVERAEPAPQPQSAPAATPASDAGIPALASAPAETAAVAEEPSTPEAPPAREMEPASGIVIPVPEAPRATAGGTFFDPLFAYASAREFSGSGSRTSAILRNPAMLEPDRIDCTRGDSTVLIDLDPDGEDLFPIDIQSASPALAERLAELRVRGIAIAWISENSADKMAQIRAALARSGLDPLGIDQVLLMRDLDERKQSRRDELARNSCLIAIAGDARSDFHELFGYLLNPSDAIALEPMVGEGWFLIPTPLVSERPTR